MKQKKILSYKKLKKIRKLFQIKNLLILEKKAKKLKFKILTQNQYNYIKSNNIKNYPNQTNYIC